MTIEVLFKGQVSVVARDAVVTFANQPALDAYQPIDWERIAAHYNIDTEEWQEKICSIVDPTTIPTGQVEVGWLTSYDILALRKGRITGHLPANVAVMGLLITSDNQIIIGLRGGSVTPETKRKFGRGVWNTVPAGQATWQSIYDRGLLEDTMGVEFAEELGFDKRHIVALSQLGAYSVKDALLPGIKFAVRIDTDLTAHDIMAQHQSAMAALGDDVLRLDDGSVTKKQLQAKLKQAGHAKDAWEHSKLMAIPNTKAGITEALQKLEWLEAGQGALELQLRSLT